MRGMPINLQGKGVLEIAAATEPLWRSAACRVATSGGGKGSIGKEGLEPRSVLDHRRSPSPPTSTSTLSSSLGGGGGGSIDTASVAAVSDNPLHNWPPSQDTTSSGAAEDAVGDGGSSGAGGGRKEEWAAELQPIPAGLEMGLMGGDKCGLEMEDWESVLSEPTAAAASPGHDQTFLRWIMGDVDDHSSFGLKQQNHQGSLEFEGGAGGGGGFGVVDPVFGFESAFGIGGGASSSVVAHPLSCSTPVASAGGFSAVGNNGSTNNGNRILPIPPGAGPLPGIKVSPFGNNSNPNIVLSSSPASSIPPPLSLPPGMLFQEPAVEEKAHLFNRSVLLNQQQVQTPQNPAFFLPLSPYTQPDHQHQQQQLLLPPHPKRHHSLVDLSCQVTPRIPASNSAQDLFLRRHQQPQQQPPPQSFESLHVLSSHSAQQRPTKLPGDEPTAAAAAAAQQQQQHQALVDQLLKGAELVEAGNLVNAHGILARLNHHLSPIGKPLIRSAFYCKEALQSIITQHSNSTPLSPSPPLQRNPSPPSLSSPLDVVLKLSAYKAFSDISPILQFANFTCTQALLEELNGFDLIHIVDFDIGVGGHWSSFMQELAQRRCASTAASPSLRITAFISLSSHHPFELGLTRENLSHFASELSIPFEFNILSVDSFDPAGLLNMSQNGEAIAVNLPAGSSYPSTPTLLRLVKQLSPKIVVSVDYVCDHSDYTFSRHFLHVLQSTTVLLDSIDAAGSTQEVASKIERYLLQPRIDKSVLGRHRAAEKALPWWALFASAGFVSAPFSNFTETQAECLLKRLQVRGFHVEKRQASLLLCWQRVGLVSVSAWRC